MGSMRRPIFAKEVFERCRKRMRWGRFLKDMERAVPWNNRCEAMEPLHPRVKGAHRSGRSGCCASPVSSIGSICQARRE